MIRSLVLKNFKPFEFEQLKFRHLTLLSGLNSTGKSSVIQALLLLRQSYQQSLLPDIGLALNGDLVCIGTAQDALFEAAKDDVIGFDLLLEDDTQGRWRFDYNREADVIALSSPKTAPEVYKSSLFSDKFHYLQAERIGPRTYFEISDFQVRQHEQIGTRGEYTAHFLSTYRDKDIPNSNLSHPEAKSLNLKDQVEAWMGEVSPGTRIEIKSNQDMDLVNFQYSYGLSNPYRATNVGFGITYTLPIIVAVLSSPPGTLILLENPEAHLHPKGQSKMGELLALAASCGVQVVIETHSDHVLNGIRLAVHGGKLDYQNVQLHYFQRQEKEGYDFIEVVSPKIRANGRIDQWPDGFFDQMEKDLMELI
ncbi:AAA family ATPase [Coleofasciculus sp. F4-SAH-05]|uniref:AAA family ATPase n=1 Tax=Coleofasciculus sp. F4-SAH-05 TaxID=3069525 RepID=UPI0032FB6103